MKNIRKLVLFFAIIMVLSGVNVYATTVGEQLPEPEQGWARYDESNGNIIYSSDWLNCSSNAYHNGVVKYTNVTGATINFKFYGTKLRLIGVLNEDRPSDIQVLVDGVPYTGNQYATSVIYKGLFFEISGLTLDNHTVQIITPSTATTSLDAIDIDEDGYLIAQLGTKLLAPEPGWKRYDDNAPEFIYKNFDQMNYVDNVYNTTYSGISATSTLIPEMDFKFYGSKLRFIGVLNTAEHRGIVKIIIDGVEHEFSQVGQSENPAHTYDVSILQFEKTGLTKGIHTVKITRDASQTGKSMWIDAIDIDKEGYLLSVNTPDAPTNLTATASNSNITLNWNAVTDADSYTILKSTISSDIDTVIATNVTETTYIDTDVESGVTYYYVVRAVKNDVASPDSNIASAMIEENTNVAVLQIKLSTTDIYEYRMTMSDVEDFMNWYIARLNGTGLPFYKFAVDSKIEPYTDANEYLIFDKIVWFKVKEYLQ